MYSQMRLAGLAVWGAALLSAFTLVACNQVDQISSSIGLNPIDLAIESDDPCGAQRQAFSESRSYFTSSLIKTASSMSFGGNSATAAPGAEANGFSGILSNLGTGLNGGTSYLKAMTARISDPKFLASAILNDLATEGRQIDSANQNFAMLRDCRFRAAHSIRLELQHGRISRAVASDKLAAERKRFDEELAVARQLGTNMQQREEEYQQAAEEYRQPPPEPQSAGASAPQSQTHAAASSQVQVAATKTIPEKRSTFENSVGSATAESQIAFNLDSSKESRGAEPLDGHG